MRNRFVFGGLVLSVAVLVVGYWFQYDGPVDSDPQVSQEKSDEAQANTSGRSADDASSGRDDEANDSDTAANASGSGASGARPSNSNVAMLVERISLKNKYESRKAVTELTDLDDSHIPDLIDALLAVSDRIDDLVEQIQQPGLAKPLRDEMIEELEASSWRKNQLIVLLGHRSDPRIIDALIAVAKQTHPESLEQSTIAISLASQGPSRKSRQYFMSLVTNEDASYYQKKGAIGYLSQNPEPSDQPVVDQLLQDVGDPKLAGVLMVWGASVKPEAEMRALIKSHLSQPGLTRDEWYLPLFALAEVANPEEFNSVTEGVDLYEQDKQRALRLSRFNHASVGEKEGMIESFVSSGAVQHKLAAVKFVLQNNRVDLLQQHLVFTFQGPSGELIYASRGYERLITLAGYKIRLQGDELMIDTL